MCTTTQQFFSVLYNSTHTHRKYVHVQIVIATDEVPHYQSAAPGAYYIQGLYMYKYHKQNLHVVEVNFGGKLVGKDI